MSVDTFDPNQDVVTLTESAIHHFQTVLKGKGGQLIRLATKESGCSGYAYELGSGNRFKSLSKLY